MSLHIEFITAQQEDARHPVAVIAYQDGILGDVARTLDAGVAGALSRNLTPRFTGKPNNHALLHSGRLIILIGAGPETAPLPAHEQAAHACQVADRQGLSTLTLRLEDASPEGAARAAFGARLGSYRFHRYKSSPSEQERPLLQRVNIITTAPEQAKAAFERHEAVAAGVFLARDLTNEPANALYPEQFVSHMEAIAPPGLQVEALDVAQMQDLGMHALLCVGQGSARDSRLLILRWQGADDPQAAPLAFVGKGVTFDSGGLSIKPAASMELMKQDMGAAASIAGLMLTLATRRAAVNAVAVLGLVENMVDAHSTRPGDVVTSLSGQTIEVVNTDAEGRLVLADALAYCERRFKPRLMIDLATLTGAVMVALGTDYAGLFSEHDPLSAQLIEAGIAEGEPLWRLPMPESYQQHLHSQIADMKNVAGIRFGGASIAARFLRKFVGDTPWAHLDVSSPIWRDPANSALAPPGATGYGVRLLNRFISERYEAV